MALHQPELGEDLLGQAWNEWTDHLLALPAKERPPVESTLKRQYAKLRNAGGPVAVKAIEWPIEHRKNTISNANVEIATEQVTGRRREEDMDPEERKLRKEMGLL